MFSEQIKYNTPLPGEEFRSRDLSIPAEAAKVLYEIDFQYGQSKELCLTILARVFRGSQIGTQVLQEVGKGFQGSGQRSAPWHQEAIVLRSVRAALLERKVSSVSKVLESLESDLMLFKGQAR